MIRLLVPLAVLLFGLIDRLPADDAPAAEAPLAHSPAELRRAVRQLDADEFSLRKTARDLLLATGLPAVEPLQEIAAAADGHLAQECIQLLEEFTHRPDGSLAAAATAVLKRLADGDNPPVARLAAAALTPAPVIPDSPLTLARNRLALRVPAPLPGIPFDADGKRSVEVEDAGRQVRIEENRGGRITVRITTTVDGVEQTAEHAGDHPADLLANNREAFELYLRHLVQPRIANGPVFGLGPGVGVQFRFQITNNNGQRKIRAETNGRVTEVSDENGRQIRMAITDPAAAPGDPPRTIEADDVEHLRQLDPDAAAEYERLTGGGQFGIQIQGRIFPRVP